MRIRNKHDRDEGERFAPSRSGAILFHRSRVGRENRIEAHDASTHYAIMHRRFVCECAENRREKREKKQLKTALTLARRRLTSFGVTTDSATHVSVVDL